MKIIILFVLVVFVIAIASFLLLKDDMSSVHEQRPQRAPDGDIVEEQVQKIMNSDYYASLTALRDHVAGHKVVSSIVGNAGFVLLLDNDTWAAAYRADQSILSDHGVGAVPVESLKIINSAHFGDASVSASSNKIYATETNDVGSEVKKSHGAMIVGLSRGARTFNFTFTGGMELDFQLCNDNAGKPAIRVFWEQW